MTKPLAPIVVEILFWVDFHNFRMSKRDAKKIATDSGIQLQKKKKTLPKNCHQQKFDKVYFAV